MPGNQGTATQLLTRRTKRKVDDGENGSAGNPRKRSTRRTSNSTGSSFAANSARAKLAGNASRSKAAAVVSANASQGKPTAGVSTPASRPRQDGNLKTGVAQQPAKAKKSTRTNPRRQSPSSSAVPSDGKSIGLKAIMIQNNINEDVINQLRSELQISSGDAADTDERIPESVEPSARTTRRRESDNDYDSLDDDAFDPDKNNADSDNEEYDDAFDSVGVTDKAAVPHAPNLGDSGDEVDVSFNDQSEKAAQEVLQEEADDEIIDVEDAHETDPSQHASTVNEQQRREMTTLSPEVHNGLENNRTQLQNTKGVDESMVLSIVSIVQKAVQSQIDSSFNQFRKEALADRADIRKLREEVTQATSIITTTASSIFIKHPASTPRMKEIQKKLCLLPALFNENTMLKIIPRVVTGFFTNRITDGSAYATLEGKGVQFFAVMLFSLQANDKKAKFSSQVGQVYSKFRYSLLMSSFLALQSNTFNTFIDNIMDTTVIDLVAPSNGDNSNGQRGLPMLQPFWLKPGYVVSEHCSSASTRMQKRAHVENTDGGQSNNEPSQSNADNESTDVLDNAAGPDSSQSSGKQKVNRSGPLTRTEIATEGATMLYRIITSILYRSRLSSKTQLFYDLTYLFTGWKHHDPPVDQQSLSIRWGAPLKGDIDYIDGLARTKVLRPQDRHSTNRLEMDKADLGNIAHLETLISQHPELSLLVEHDVLVNDTVTRLSYRINLIEAACRFLASYITLDSVAKAKDALCTDRYSLKVIVVLAIGLRKLIDKPVRDLASKGSVPWYLNKSVSTTRGRPKRSKTSSNRSEQSDCYKFEEIQGLNLDQLQPAPSKQKEALNNLILKMTEQEFSSKHLHGNGENNLGRADSNTPGGPVGINEAPIEADESQGVFSW